MTTRRERIERLCAARRAIEKWDEPTMLVRVNGQLCASVSMPPRRLFDELHAASMALATESGGTSAPPVQ